jgi:Flp pilus assembly protein TadD
LRGELQQLRSENSSLQAKLREALSVRPTSVDPRELQLAEEKNMKLTKELALLKSDLSQATTNVATAPDSRELAKVQAALEQETRRADQLAADRAALASQVSALQASAAVAAALREENSLLKAQLAETRSGKATGTEAQQRRLDEMATELAMIRSEANILQLEKGALEARMQKLKNDPGAMGAANVSELSNSKAQISELERERTQLQLQLAQANQELANRSVVSVGEPSGQAQAEVDRLKARLAVYESEQIPYSVEELALFRMSKALSASNATRPMPPKDAGPLVAQAERQFQGGQFPEAEATLKEILHKDESNAFTLANLAATQMEQGKDAEAEVNLRNALATAPRDPFSLATMGILQFRKQHYEEALDYLGLATQYKPDDPVILNYLGMALSEKGMRGPAETALRRAIQLQPGFGDAHFNLALVYILQDPPLRELARWHYQKALEVGHPRSTETEQLLDSSGTN